MNARCLRFRAHRSGFFALLTLTVMLSPLRALDPARPVRDYRIAEWGVTNGLPYPSIAALAQSADGYIWVGTRTGLGRFDGVTFTTFNHENRPELVDDHVTALFAARDGTLWIGTSQGITWYRHGTWSRPALAPELEGAAIAAIQETPEGAMLISFSFDRAITTRQKPSALYRYFDGRCVEVPHAEGLEVPRLNAITPTTNGDVLVAGNGIFRLQPGGLRPVPLPDVSNPQIFAMTAGTDGNVWLAGLLGLVHLEGSRHRLFSTADGLPSNSARSLLVDRDHNLWVGTSNGVARYSGGRFQPLLMYGVESLSNTLCMIEDAESNLWIGTDNGLYRVQDVKVATFGQRDGLPVNPTLCVLEARDGSHWVGTIGGGLAHLTEQGVATLHSRDGLKEESIGALAEGADGSLWIGYYGRGLGRYANGRFSYYTAGDAVRFRGLAVDHRGGVWAASSDGLFRFDGQAFQRVPLQRELAFPRALHIDAQDNVWIACARAVGRLRAGSWTIYPKPADLESQVFQYLFSDSTGAVWALQDGPRLTRLRDGRVDRFDFPGLGPLVYSGFEYQGELWVNFRAGVARIPLAEFDAVTAGRKPTPAYTLFTDADGMRSRAPNNAGSPGSAPMRDGSLWFSTSMGIAMINPAHIRANARPPNVILEHVFADKKEIAGGDLRRIPPGRGELAFHFTALSFVNPAQIRFRYQLRGFDAGWIDGGGVREAHYGGLPPGRYTFEVTACNNEGVWNPQGARCELVLRPHYYEQWWFFVGVLVAIGGSGFGVYRWRSRRLQRRARELQRQNDELERRIAERTTELRQSYEALRSSEYFYHSLVESLPQVIVRKDVAGRYTYANDNAAELFHRPVTEVVGRTDAELVPADLARSVRVEDERVLATRQPIEREEVVETAAGSRRYLHVKRVPLYNADNQPLGVQVLFWDMTVFRETEDKLKHAQRELLEISRLAGIAEMATGVLHNLGNALNSVKVAAAVARDQLTKCDPARLVRVAEMLKAEGDHLPEFFARDPRAAKLPTYLGLLGEQLESERAAVLREMQQLSAGIEHVAQIIAAQQEGARVTGLVEHVAPKELVEYALRMNQASIDRHSVVVTREYTATPDITVDRQKVLQILANLVRNALEAMTEAPVPEKRLGVTVAPEPTGGVLISVADNGAGIAAENLRRIFQFGFTTKRTGHGFGLHNSANAAQELGGALRVQSPGPGHGAVFTLHLPPAPPTRTAAVVVDESPLAALPGPAATQ